jgi:hypothetical protein
MGHWRTVDMPIAKAPQGFLAGTGALGHAPQRPWTTEFLSDRQPQPFEPPVPFGRIQHPKHTLVHERPPKLFLLCRRLSCRFVAKALDRKTQSLRIDRQKSRFLAGIERRQIRCFPIQDPAYAPIATGSDTVCMKAPRRSYVSLPFRTPPPTAIDEHIAFALFTGQDHGKRRAPPQKLVAAARLGESGVGNSVGR